MLKRTLFVVLLLGLMSVNGWAFTFVCGFDPQSRSGDFQYDYDDYDAVRMKFIYVDLQGDNISPPSPNPNMLLSWWQCRTTSTSSPTTT